MASRLPRKNLSFNLLSNNSPGDGDSIFVADNETTVDERAENKLRRRRKKLRSRRSSMGDLSPMSILEGEGALFSVPPSPLSNVGFENSVPPLQGLRALGVNPSLLSPGWQDDDSQTGSSPSLSAYSPDGPLASAFPPVSSRVSGLGSDMQGEFRSRDTSKEPAASRIAGSPSDSLQLLSQDVPNVERNSEDRSSQSNAAPHEFFNDPEVLRDASEFRNHETSVSVVSSGTEKSPLDAQAPSERSVKTSQQLPPKAPDFSSASDGLAEPAFVAGSLHPPTELRQPLLEKTSDKEGEENSAVRANGEGKQRSRPVSNPSEYSNEHATPPSNKIRLGTHATPHLKDWQRLMDSQAHCQFLNPLPLDDMRERGFSKNLAQIYGDPPPLDLSPMQYLATEIFSGSTLRNTTSIGNDQRRERVYNTMFHVPWRCELLIDVGFVVCLDAFLALFTVMPARIVMFIWQRLAGILRRRPLERLQAPELCDFGCLIVLIVGVAILMQADISIIYHWIRGQGVIKLYVVFNVLEVLFNSAVAVECCKSNRLLKEMARFAFDQCIAIFSFFVHSLVIISQAITISAAVNAQNNALLTLLISNNFAEIKSNVFKRMGTDQLHKMAYHDTVERFHIMTHVLFVWAQNVLNAEDSLWRKFFHNAGMVFLCEVMVDVIKHSFLAKFNEVKPAAYSEFLQALCSQTLNSQSHEVHKTLTFVPLAPACVVMRILLPVYAACIPEGPIWWRLPSMVLLGGLTYIALVLLKVFVGLGLQFHAKWYLNRHPWTAPHPHFE